MGGRNGGAMGKSKLDQEKHDKKNKVVTMAQEDSGKGTEEGGKGKKKAAGKAAKTGGKRESKSKEEKGKEKQREKEKKEKEAGKGARKALRHAVKAVVRTGCTGFAGSLMNQAKDGNVRSTEIMLSLMEKKKKDGEDDDGDGGLSLAERLAAEPSWDDVQEAKRKAKEKEAGTEAA